VFYLTSAGASTPFLGASVFGSLAPSASSSCRDVIAGGIIEADRFAEISDRVLAVALQAIRDATLVIGGRISD
jgi:hypothetical protein